MYYCVEHGITSCRKKICCHECDFLMCSERCNLDLSICRCKTKIIPMDMLEFLELKCGDIKKVLDI